MSLGFLRDFFGQMIKHAFALGSGHQPKRQRQHTRRLRAVAVKTVLRFKEFVVERGLELLGEFAEAPGVIRLIQEVCVAGHQFQAVVKIAGGQYFRCRAARRIF
jgi:hypothetical protein